MIVWNWRNSFRFWMTWRTLSIETTLWASWPSIGKPRVWLIWFGFRLAFWPFWSKSWWRSTPICLPRVSLWKPPLRHPMSWLSSSASQWTKRLAPSLSIVCSSYPALSSQDNSQHSCPFVSFAEHEFQKQELRAAEAHESGSHWGPRQGRRYRNNRVPQTNRNHSPLPQDHEKRPGSLEDCCHFHCSENNLRPKRLWIPLHPKRTSQCSNKNSK